MPWKAPKSARAGYSHPNKEVNTIQVAFRKNMRNESAVYQNEFGAFLQVTKVGNTWKYRIAPNQNQLIFQDWHHSTTDPREGEGFDWKQIINKGGQMYILVNTPSVPNDAYDVLNEVFGGSEFGASEAQDALARVLDITSDEAMQRLSALLGAGIIQET